jgi:hypothetical protein
MIRVRDPEPMRFLKYLVLAPIAALILIFAYANREWVTIYFDPVGFSGLKPVSAPEYAALLVAAAAGVIAGGAATWLGQGRHRRALRDAEAEISRLRGELQAARFAAHPALPTPA